MEFSAYIDESYNRDVFVFTAATGLKQKWWFFSSTWESVLKAVNEKLLEQNRCPITRYHATDCAGLGGEFKGWSVEEQKTLTGYLINLIGSSAIHSITYIVKFSDIKQAHAEAFNMRLHQSNLHEAAYYLTMQLCFHELATYVRSQDQEARIQLNYDQCAFAFFFQHAARVFGEHHGTIFDQVQEGDSRQMVALQAADFIAYENLKDEMNRTVLKARNRRKSLELLLRTGTGFVSRTVRRDWLTEILYEHREFFQTLTCEKGE